MVISAAVGDCSPRATVGEKSVQLVRSECGSRGIVPNSPVLTRQEMCKGHRDTRVLRE